MSFLTFNSYGSMQSILFDLEMSESVVKLANFSLFPPCAEPTFQREVCLVFLPYLQLLEG